MRVVLDKFDGLDYPVLLYGLVKLCQYCRLVLVEQLLSLEIFIRGDHYIIEIAIGHLQIVEVAYVALC